MHEFDAFATFIRVSPLYHFRFMLSGVNSARKSTGPVSLPNVPVSQVAGFAEPSVAVIPVANA